MFSKELQWVSQLHRTEIRCERNWSSSEDPSDAHRTFQCCISALGQGWGRFGLGSGLGFSRALFHPPKGEVWHSLGRRNRNSCSAQGSVTGKGFILQD